MIQLSNKEFIEQLAVGIPSTASLTLHSFHRDPSTGGNWTAHPQSTELSPHNNNYVSVSAFNLEQGQVKRRRVLFNSLQAVMIDDLGSKLPMSDLKLAPTALIETSPGNFQAYLFLKEPIADVYKATQLIDAMVESGISAENDPGMKGVTRVGRLPQGKNTKAKYGKPFEHVTHLWNPGIRYSPQEIIDAYDLTIKKLTRGPVPKIETNGWDWIIDYLKEDTNLHIAEMRPGYHKIVCPWFARHTDEVKSGTYYMEPSPENRGYGGFQCHHGSCSDFHVTQFNAYIALRKAESTGKRSNKSITDFIREDY